MSLPALPRSSTLTPHRIAISSVFGINGFLFAQFIARIPTLKAQLALEHAALGFSFLGMTVGSLLFMPMMGLLIGKVGSRAVVQIAAVCFCLAIILPTLVQSALGLFLVLVVLGASNGSLDVAMNAQANSLEGRWGKPIMNSFHAMWSLGSLLGIAVGSVFARYETPLLLHWGSIALVSLLGMGLSFLGLLKNTGESPESPEASSKIKTKFKAPTMLWIIGTIAVAGLLSEGAMADWSAVYLKEDLKANAGIAALGFGAVQLSMFAMRLAGDQLSARWGASRLIGLSGLFIAGGMALTLWLEPPLLALGGFVVVGIGLATLFPLALSFAGKIPGLPAASGIAWVSSLGYTGFLAGPPIIGLLAQWMGLRGALGLVVVMGLVVFGLSWVLRSSESAPTP
jgi:MFS family permease